MHFNLKKATRDTISYVVGVSGIVYETLVEHVDRPYLLAAFLGMLGIPAVSRRDPKKPEEDE